MALSNIFREPRREITESVVGLILAAPYVWVSYLLGCWLHTVPTSNGTIVPLPVCMFFGAALAAIGLAFLVATHALGDAACNALQRVGLHLRPRVRR